MRVCSTPQLLNFSTILSVIDSVHFPNPFGFMSANQIAILELHVVLGAGPRFFVPPISGKQKRPALLDDFAGNVPALKMSMFRSKHRRSRSRPKPSERRFQNR